MINLARPRVDAFGDPSVYRTYCLIENQDRSEWDGKEFDWKPRSNFGIEFEDDSCPKIYIEYEKAIQYAMKEEMDEVKIVKVTEYWDDNIDKEERVIRSVNLGSLS